MQIFLCKNDFYLHMSEKSTTFAADLRQKWVHSLFAGVMLIAFAGMMAVKDLHHHHHDCCCEHCLPSGEVNLSAADDCPICHFTIAPQCSDIVVPAIEVPTVNRVLQSFFLFSYTAVEAERPSSRGPPVC